MRFSPGILLLPLLALVACASPDPSEIARCPSGPAPGSEVSVLSLDLPEGDAIRGAAVYAQQCIRCHATRPVDRESGLFRGYPRLDCEGYADRVGRAYLVAVVARGGTAVGLEDTMKPFAELLTPTELADVVAYLQQGAANPR